MNKEKVFETIDALNYALDNAENNLRTLRIGYFRAGSYGKTIRVDKLVTLINVLQEALENFYEEDFTDLEEISI